MPQKGRVLSAAVAVFAALTSGLIVTTPAVAHDYLVTSTPASGSTVTKPVTRVSLSFDDVVLYNPEAGLRSLVIVTNSAGKHFETGCATALDRVVSVPVSLGAAGAYTVTWDIVSADGHPVTNSIRFTYAPASSSGATVNAGLPSSPCTYADSGQSVSSASPHSTNSGTNSAQGASTSNLVAVVALSVGGAAALVAIAVVVWLVATRRRNSP